MMNDFDYFVCEYIYEAAVQSPASFKIKKEIGELQFLLAKEDIRRYKAKQQQKKLENN